MAKSKGRHPVNALSAQFVRSAKPGFHADGNGLYLVVDQAEDGKPGARRWVQRLMVRGKRTDIGLGGVSYKSLAEAREDAIANRKIARAGGDPLEGKRKALAIPTFATLAKKLHEELKPTFKNEKHSAQFITTLETYAFPHIGKKRVNEIELNNVRDVLSPIWHEKAETARRVKQRMARVFDYAVEKGHMDKNPAKNGFNSLGDNKKAQENRPAVPYADIHTALTTIKESGASETTKLALEFQLLTAARPGEARNAMWSEIDLDKGIWTVPAERTKMDRLHRAPLSPRAVEILTEAQAFRTDDCDLVFPALDRSGKSNGKPISDATLSKLMREREIPSDQPGKFATPHGFRSTFKQWCQERSGYADQISEFALAHVDNNAARAAYARSDLFDIRRDLMNDWAKYLTK